MMRKRHVQPGGRTDHEDCAQRQHQHTDMIKFQRCVRTDD
jgi:hypothetical protein